VGGFALTVIGFLADGWSTRSLKIVAIWIVSIFVGAALSHAAGRALLHRDRFPAQGEKP
jgi:multicomponent Na+:H+ antiporter subunit G